MRQNETEERRDQRRKELVAAISERARQADVLLAVAELQQLARYYELLAQWNPRMNLTALRLDGYPSPTIDRLLIEPILAAREVHRGPLVWFDFGSGGGSPAIPLKILRPAATLMMVESRERKCAFLREAIRDLRLSGASVLQGRVEEISVAAAKTASLVTIRALRLDVEIQRQAAGVLEPSGRLALFGTDAVPAIDRAVFEFEHTTPLPSPTAAIHWFRRRL